MKHISDQEVPIKFIVCGIGDSLDEMIGSHLSTGRYLMPIELDRLPHDARFESIASAADGVTAWSRCHKSHCNDRKERQQETQR
jgi:hypothetical protein